MARSLTHPLKQCHISVLPDELLFQIFSYFPLKAHWELENKECQASLVSVCQRWRRIYEPLLFRRIPLCLRIEADRSKRTIVGARKLLALMKDRPHICSYPRTAHLELSYPLESNIADLLCLVELCRELRSIIIFSDLWSFSLPLLQTITSLPLVEDLTLATSTHYGPKIDLIVRTFSMPKLKRLRLESYETVGNYFDAHHMERNSYEEKGIQREVLEELLPPSRQCTSSVEILELIDPHCKPLTTEYILRGPSCLVSLTFWCLNRVAMDDHCIHQIQKLLDIHSRTLKIVKLGLFTHGRAAMPNFSMYPCLEELHLSARNVLKVETQTALANLCTPSLRLLVLNFNTEDERIGIRSSFVSDETNYSTTHALQLEFWIHDFALRRKSSCQPVSLSKIRINFTPTHSAYRWTYPPSRTAEPILITSRRDRVKPWPWEQLENAKHAAAEYGLVVEYSTPPYTKEEWPHVRLECEQEFDVIPE